ncbi:cache domain-containing protein [Desulfonema magnum]|uniref:histidine kinase n=1 Tax=Desulfonema magnum TaxID=45655 RepID=A0A975BSB3_9BACT|nr:cache domain-containing protein [Desulfonema magnum]QTA90527.1 Histidine kinase, double Cache and PAS domains-containing [Desulfonema magnum]
MKIRFSISLKLLVFILPLVCAPIAAVGYFSIRASADRVDHLVSREQMVQAKATANEINDIFYYCRMDLKTIASLPVLEEYHIARTFRLNAEAEFNYDNAVRLFRDFIDRTPYYFQIRYVDEQGLEQIKVRKNSVLNKFSNQSDQKFFTETRRLGPDGIYISEIVRPDFRKGFIIRWAKAIFSGQGEFIGIVVIDLDYQNILEIVKNIRIGEQGYAFLVDHSGRNITHPRFEPYTHDLKSSPDLSFKELILKMMSGASDRKLYFFEEKNRVAAFAPIPVMGWSLAVTISIDEFRKEARAIQTRVIQVVALTLIFTVICVSLISYYLLRPVRSLVTATHRIARGNLTQEIPVRTRDELGDLTRSFNRMTQNLTRIHNELVRSEKFVALGRLSAGVAHEIRNPLNAMKGAVVYLRRRRSDDLLITEYSDLIMEEIDRLNEFVNEFLYFARQSSPKPVPADLNKLVLSNQNLFEKQAEEKGICFHNRLADDLPVMQIDPHQIQQVLVNIIINAIDAMPEGGEIIFSSMLVKNEASSERVRLTIEDSGIGIPKNHLQNIFDPFFSTKETGSGLGLPLSLGIMENHGGTISISSEQGRGVLVSLEWPLANHPEC